jgi:hypothetical protein
VWFVSVVMALATLASVAPVGNVQRAGPATADEAKREFRISGCLVRKGYAGYQVEEARVEAIDGKPMAEPTASTPARLAFPKKWILEGGGSLGRQVGEKVEIVGHSDWQPSVSSADEGADRTPRLEVTSVKTLASSCSP